MYDKTTEGRRTDPAAIEAEDDGTTGSLQRRYLQQEYQTEGERGHEKIRNG